MTRLTRDVLLVGVPVLPFADLVNFNDLAVERVVVTIGSEKRWVR